MINAILTGSRKYGRPHRKSDIDLVVLMDYEETIILAALADKVEEEDPYHSHTGVMGLTFGKLHLLVCTGEEEFRTWVEGTQVLFDATRNKKAGNPYAKGVPRDLSILYFDRLRALRGNRKTLGLGEVAREMDAAEEEDDEEEEPETEEDEEDGSIGPGDWVKYRDPKTGRMAEGTVISINSKKDVAEVSYRGRITRCRLSLLTHMKEGE